MKKQLIILGGGTSVIEGIENDLFEKIRNKFVIGLNYSHHYTDSTIQTFVDWKFYDTERSLLNKLPLVVGQRLREIKNPSKKIFLFNAHNRYMRNLDKGIYKATLCGLFSLSLAIWLLDEGEIFLLGYDNGAKKGDGAHGRAYDDKGTILTHWYQHKNMISRYTKKVKKFRHRGIGKVNWYEATQQTDQGRISRAEHEYGVYKEEAKVKIFNVSQESNIPTFEKINYEEFFKKLNNKTYDQAILRHEMREKINLLEKR